MCIKSLQIKFLLDSKIAVIIHEPGSPPNDRYGQYKLWCPKCRLPIITVHYMITLDPPPPSLNPHTT